MRQTNHFFHEGDLRATLDGHRREAEQYVANIPKDQFLNSSTETLVEHVLSKHRAEPLVLYRDRAEMEEDETDIAVTNDRLRGGSWSGRSISIRGVLITLIVPFTGEPIGKPKEADQPLS